MLGSTAACALRQPEPIPVEIILPSFLEEYEPLFDAGFDLPGIPVEYTTGINRRMSGIYLGEAPENSIDVDPYAKFLYHVKGDGTAVRYPIGVGRAGRSFSGTGVIRLKKQWPGWSPTQNMLRTEPEIYGPFRVDCAARLARVPCICSAMGVTHITVFTEQTTSDRLVTREARAASACSTKT